MSRRLTKPELAVSMHDAGRNSEEIAIALEVPVDAVDEWLSTIDTAVSMLRAQQAGPDLLAACEADDAFHQHFDNCDACGEDASENEGDYYCKAGAVLRETANSLRGMAIGKARGGTRP